MENIKMGLTEHRYKDIREKLDKLGYRQPLGFESLLLVEHLLADLLHTTDNLKHYKNIAQQTLEKCGELECGVEPYRLENAKLMQECNKLHQKLINERESAEKLEKELKTRVRSLENTNADLEFICAQHLNKIHLLNSELAEKGQKLLNLKGIKTSVNGVKKDKKNLASVRSKNSDEKQRPFSGTTQVTTSSGYKSDNFCSNICNVSKNQYDLLLNELKELKKERLEFIEDIASFKKQVSTRNEEISRLQSLLEGGQPIIAMNKDCMCCEACSCKKQKTYNFESQLKEQLRECQDLQHEAMCRAVTLAERNKVLEAELKQRQCCQCVTSSNATKGQIDKLTQLLHCRYRDIEKLKSDLAEVLKKNSALEKDKASADHVLEGLVEERKQLNERVNRLTIIERDLVAEIDRLTERSESQKLKLIELEQKLNSYEKLSKEKDLTKRKDIYSSENFGESDQRLITSSEMLNGKKIVSTNGVSRVDRSKGKKVVTSSDAVGTNGRVRSYPPKTDNLLKKSQLPVRSGDLKPKSKTDSKGIKSHSKDVASKSYEILEEEVSESSSGSLEDRQITLSDTAEQRKVNKRKHPPLCNCEDHEHFDRDLLVKLKESCEEELNNAKQNLLEERKRFELIIKDLTNKQMKLMEKLDEKQLSFKESSDAIMSLVNSSVKAANNAKIAADAKAVSDNKVLSSQHAAQQQHDTDKTDSGEPDWLKLERIQAECEYYYKEFSRLRDKIMSVSEDGSDAISSRGVQPVSLKLERLLAEREFFCNEYHALQEQITSLSCDDGALSVVRSRSVISVPVCTNTSIPVEISELKSKLDEKDEEILMLKQKLQDSHEHLQSGSIHQLEMEIGSLKNNINSLEEDKKMLKEKLKEVTESNVQEITRLEKTVQCLTEKLQKSEFERRSISNSINDANHHSRILEDEINQYCEEINKLRSDHAQQRSSLNNIKLLQDQTDRALSTSQDILSQTENELKSALDRLRESQVEKLSLEREISNLRNEHSLLRSSLTTLDQEKDSLLLRVDEKTERIVLNEKELKQRENRISHLEGLLADTQRKLSMSIDSKEKMERLSQNSARDLDKLKEELVALERSRDNAVRENKRLQDDLTSMTQECISTARALEIAKQEVEDLKMQLQGYVAEVQRVEEILQSKESERSQMLEQYQSLTAEATVLESSKNTLENEAKSTKNSLRAAEEKISDLKRTILDKDALVAGYEAQIGDLTSHIAGLEMKLNNELEERRLTELEFANLKELCNKMESHKNTLTRHVEEIESDKAHLESEYHQVMRKHNDLEERLSLERKNSATLENVLAETRQETLKKNISCQELQKQIGCLRDKVEELQKKLEHGNQALRRCQVEAGDYQQQVNDLRREVTHERFERVRAEEETMGSYSPSISPTTSNVWLSQSIKNDKSQNKKLKKGCQCMLKDSKCTTKLPVCLCAPFIPSNAEIQNKGIKEVFKSDLYLSSSISCIACRNCNKCKQKISQEI